MKIYMSKEDLATFLDCSSVLEAKVSAAYLSVARRVDDPLVRALLESIAYDSLKHSKIFMGIIKSFADVAVGDVECVVVMGKAWSDLMRLADELMRGETVSDAVLIGLVDKMMQFESVSGEEYLTRLNLQAIRGMIKDLDVDAEMLRSIFNGIIEDEKSHEKRMLMVKSILQRKKPRQ
jgi:hypothetical protein